MKKQRAAKKDSRPKRHGSIAWICRKATSTSQRPTNEGGAYPTYQEWWKDRKEIINDEVGEKSRVFTAQQLIDLDCNFDQCKFPKEEEEILPPAELLKQYFEKRAALDHEIDKTLSEIQKILGIDIKSCN